MSERMQIEIQGENPLLSTEEVNDLVFQRELFEDPIKKLRYIRNVLKEKESSDKKVDNALLQGLKIILEALGENVYGFHSHLPDDFLILIDSETAHENVTSAVVAICKNIGIKKENLRNWIISSFKIDSGESNGDKLSLSQEQKRQLDIIEEIYGTN